MKKIVLMLLSGLLLISSTFSGAEQFAKSGGDPKNRIVLSFGSSYWPDFNESTFASVLAESQSVTYVLVDEVKLDLRAGYRITDNWAANVSYSWMPHARFTTPGNSETTVIDGEIEGSVIRLAGEYSRPIGIWKLRMLASGGLARIHTKGKGTLKSGTPDITIKNVAVETTEENYEPFTTLGMRIPLVDDRIEMDLLYTHTFTEEDGVEQAIVFRYGILF